VALLAELGDMARFQIKRIAKLADGCFGVLLDAGVPFAVTAELPDLDNHPQTSCIPAARYLCRRFHSEKHPNTFEITAVPGRSAILFHTGNVPQKDLLGCVGVGEKFEPLNGANAIQESQAGFAELLRRTSGLNEFELEIVEV
jgi:hypothetical protein